ncbi:DUF4214 domain-containing protein [Komagataeibacter sp. FNDCR2]|uniref:DUF4214 domain-containing protein n=1 Tax=Komagataeibacter sp. FNDCR2 TaxID=2878682 RepID=UPI001E54BE06|nr:DUF4214 domain-containing protein [Komagataeibacter sp. FNDCR2]MCE2574092.1 DUF4214 domain-containing protein [Komagataeibacter sp. FNDCR2]
MRALKDLLKDVVLFDMTILINHPIRTGIQRVTHQLALHWPANRPLLPFIQVAGNRIALLAPEILTQTERYFSTGADLIQQAALTYAGNAKQLSEGFYRMMAMAGAPLVEVDAVFAARESRGILSIELSVNTNFYGRLAQEVPDKVFLLNYDYILWMHPEFNKEVDWTRSLELSEYFSVIRKFHNLSFISTKTHDDYYKYIDPNCRRQYPIIIPGADALGAASRDHIGPKAEFVIVGTVEPRKQHLSVMRAIETVQAQGHDVSLTIIGKMGWLTPEDRTTFLKIVDRNSRIEWLEAPADDQLITAFSRARASIFYSRTEGFGAPPVESLSLGVPVIVSDTTPSILDLPDLGQIRVSPDDFDGLCAAICDLTDPTKAQEKQDEIARLHLPTWRDFIVGLSDWMDAVEPFEASPFAIRTRLDEMALRSLISDGASIDTLISWLFRIVLGHKPSPAERTAWVDLAKSRAMDAQDVLITFLEEVSQHYPRANELYIARQGGQNIPKPQLMLTDPAIAQNLDRYEAIIVTPDPAATAKMIYNDLLEREPGPEEILGKVNAIKSGVSHNQLVIEALDCDEYRLGHSGATLTDDMRTRITKMGASKVLSMLAIEDDGDFIDGLYRTILRRPADISGRQYYTSLLQTGVRREKVILYILTSQEAERHFSPLGIDAVSGLVLTLMGRLGSADTSAMGTLGDLAASQFLSIAQIDDAAMDALSITTMMRKDERKMTAGKAEGNAVLDEIYRMRWLAQVAQSLPVARLGGIDLVQQLQVAARSKGFEALLDDGGMPGSSFIQEAYMLLFERGADAKGQAAYLARLNEGDSREAILENMLHSPEAEEKLGVDGVASLIQALHQLPVAARRKNIEALLHDGGMPGSSFIQEAYMLLFGREADAKGQAAYLARLNEGDSREAILENMLHSPEAEEKLGVDGVASLIQALHQLQVAARRKDIEALLHDDGMTGSSFIQEAYMLLLEREADAKGQAAYLARLNEGDSREAILENMLHSPEAEEKLGVDGAASLIQALHHSTDENVA